MSKYIKIAIVSAVVLLLAGCGGLVPEEFDVDVSGDVELGDAEVQHNITTIRTQVRMVDGIFYVRTMAANITIECMSVSASVVYGPEWGSVTDARDLAILTQGFAPEDEPCDD